MSAQESESQPVAPGAPARAGEETVSLDALGSPRPSSAGEPASAPSSPLPAAPPRGRPAGSPAPGAGGRAFAARAGAQELPPDPLLEAVLGKCLIQARIGEGGMGTVYQGKHLTLDISVAVKVLPPVLAQRDQAFVERFLREARTAASVHHPNIVQVLDVDFQNGYYFIVMEYVPGETAGQRQRRMRHLSEREVLEIGMDVAAGLEYARRKGIIHRDIKPENILLSADGEVKIADLGLAKRVQGQSGLDLTLGDQVIGTPYYIAPEQARNARGADHRSDLYSLGATLFHLATGRPPFEGSSAFDTMSRHLTQAAPELRAYRADLSPELAGIIRRLLEKDQAARFQTAGQVILALRRAHEQLLPAAERSLLWAGAWQASQTGLDRPGAGAEPGLATGTAASLPPVAGRSSEGEEAPSVAASLGLVNQRTIGGGAESAHPGPPGPRSLAASTGGRPGTAPLAAGKAGERPSRLWLILLFFPFLNSLGYLWIGSVARRQEWFYGGLGMLLFQILFAVFWSERLAQAGLLLVCLCALCYGLILRSRYESRALEAREEDLGGYG